LKFFAFLWYANQVAIADYGGITSLWDAYRLQQEGKMSVNYFVARVKSKAGKIADLSAIWARIWSKCGIFDCIDFANLFAKELDDLGIAYTRVNLWSNHPKGHIRSDYYWKLISTNRDHRAIRIKDTIYDNLYPKWINIDARKKDLLIDVGHQHWAFIK